jgi:1-acyl-sn-glycerol-3-phosphate acyltransferase
MRRVLAKWFSFFIFGLGTLCLVILVFPVMLVLCHPEERFQRLARRLISASFRWFIRMTNLIGAAQLEAPERDVFRGLSSKIVVANHPSLLDVVMMISLIPNADVIVQGYTERTIVRGVVRRLYILNSLHFDELMKACKASLDRGNCLVIFPEGTRTPRTGGMRLKKGAARIALLSGCDIVAVHIGGTDKYGLGKHDPFTAYNHRDKYLYQVKIRGTLSPQKYAGLETPIAVRRLSADILELLKTPAEA